MLLPPHNLRRIGSVELLDRSERTHSRDVLHFAPSRRTAHTCCICSPCAAHTDTCRGVPFCTHRLLGPFSRWRPAALSCAWHGNAALSHLPTSPCLRPPTGLPTLRLGDAARATLGQLLLRLCPGSESICRRLPRHLTSLAKRHDGAHALFPASLIRIRVFSIACVPDLSNA